MSNTPAGGSIDVGAQVDRDIPNLRTSKKKTNITKLAIFGGLLVGVVAVAGGATLFMNKLEQRKSEELALRDKQNTNDSPASAKDFDSLKKRIKQQEAANMPPPSSALSVVAVTGPVAGSQVRPMQPSQTDGKPIDPPAVDRALTGNVLVSLPSDTQQGTKTAFDRMDSGSLGLGLAPKDGFDDKLKPSQLIAGRAAQRPDLTFLMRRGTAIECGQITRIVTTYPGMVSCQIAKDVYSADGKVLLIERGSAAFGEQRRALMQGQASIEVLWSRIDTPSGVVIDINSLGTDSLGASGHPAYVDNHIAQRFGAAVMLSLISDIGQALANKAGNSAGTIQLGTTANAGQDIASKALDNTINIPPTAYSNQGSAITIFVARDMDFRSVYELARY